MGKNIFYFVVAVAFLLAIGGIIFYLVQPGTTQQPAPSVQVEEKPQGLGSEIYEQAQNPAGSIPDTNPFEGEANPFEGTQTNPFEDAYTNPFD